MKIEDSYAAISRMKQKRWQKIISREEQAERIPECSERDLMPKRIMIIDIDGTICEDIKNEGGLQNMAKAKPYRNSIRQINKWHREGHFICFFTAREEAHSKVTEAWLKNQGVKYHQIIYGKPRRTKLHSEYHFIDNCKIRATTYNGKFSEFVKKRSNILVFPSD
jgi:hypothetical protein